MVQILRLGKKQFVNLAHVVSVTLRDSGKLIDGANEVYTPVLAIDFIKGQPLFIEGEGARSAFASITQLWQTQITEPSQSPATIGLTDELDRLATEVDHVDEKLDLVATVAKITAHVVMDMLVRARGSKPPEATAMPTTNGFVANGTPATNGKNRVGTLLDRIERDLETDTGPGETPPPWADSKPVDVPFDQLGTNGLSASAADDVTTGEFPPEDDELDELLGDVVDDDPDQESPLDAIGDDADKSTYQPPADRPGTTTRYPVTAARSRPGVLAAYDGPPPENWPPGMKPTHYRELAPA